MRTTDTHLAPDEMARYLDRTAPADERAALDVHLADCLACQEELTALLGIRRSEAGRRGFWRVAVPLAAAAGLAVLLLGPGLLRRGPAPEHRAPPSEEAFRPRLIAPTGGATAEGPLVWTRVDGADRYRVTVFGRDGATVWQGTTTDTTLPLPEQERFAGGEHFFWKVEARVGTDRWAPSPLGEFSTPGPTP